MAGLDDLIDLIPIGDLAKRLGVSESAAAAAVQQVIPTMVGGMQANAAGGGSASLEAALAQHADDLRGGRLNLDAIDTTDGEKIVRNVFGGNADQVVAKVADSAPADVTKDLVAKILPIIAPIVLGWLANKFLGGSSSSAPAQQDSGGGLGDIVGDLLGGGASSGGGIGDLLGGSASSGGGIGDLLGGLLGDGSSSAAGGGIGDLLGGLLGGGRR